MMGMGQEARGGESASRAAASAAGGIKEAAEGKKPADPEHDEIAFLPRAHPHRAQGPRALALSGERFARKHQRLERASSVRRYESGHLFSLLERRSREARRVHAGPPHPGGLQEAGHQLGMGSLFWVNPRTNAEGRPA